MTSSKTVRLDKEVHEIIRVMAFNNETSIQQEINKILRKELGLDEIPTSEV